MRNPLRKRLPRELKQEFGKYVVIFLFMLGTISFVSGFLVAGGSMKIAYDQSFEKYNIEDGNFELLSEADEELRKCLEKEGVKIYSGFYIDADEENGNVLRVFENRDEVNKVCLMEGEFPTADNEIAIDRMYADNNETEIGNIIVLQGEEYRITGLVALSDYSALFSDNNDLMFDAVKFGTAIVTKEGYMRLDKEKQHYNYFWKYNDAADNEEEERKKADNLLEILAQNSAVISFIPRYSNQAIQFTGNDIGKDKSMMIVLLYILIVIIAFVFSVTISNTISSEATVIGTLRASGYKKRELLTHYMTLPMLVTTVAAGLGNILGYTFLKDMVADLYYGSYSLPTYTTVWNMEAFVLTTVIPLVIMIVINWMTLISKLSLSPLKFLRRDLSKRQKKRAVRLPSISFFGRFRIRIILQNFPNYLTLLIGILFANTLLLFGMMMTPLIDHYEDEVIKHNLAPYQYILKAPMEPENGYEAEKFCITSLETIPEHYDKEAVTVYGIEENSIYVPLTIKSQIYISDGFAEKYDLKVGDSVTLKEEYGDKEYHIEIDGIYEYPAALAVFMSRESFAEMFETKKDYFNGYFSKEECEFSNENMVASVVTKEDFTKLTRQLHVSMGGMFIMINAFAVLLYMLLIYLLSKLIIEKNAASISMIKILGYNNGEISRLYLMSTTIVVLISLAVSIPGAYKIIELLYHKIMESMAGWVTYYVETDIFVKMLILGIASYGILAFIQFIRVKNVPMDEALKNGE